MTEVLPHDPPGAEELDRASSLVACPVQGRRGAGALVTLCPRVVGLAGTVSALASYDQGLELYDRAAVHHYQLRGRPSTRRCPTWRPPTASPAALPGIDRRERR